MPTQMKVIEKYGRNSEKTILTHETEMLTMEGRMAFCLIEKWGMVAATVNGEDSAGRSQIIELTPDQVVDRAVSITEKALAAFRSKEWIVQGPDISELLAS